ncbi:TRAP dicarboxylate transporter, DctM subunit [uncultured delta proteobacterium]|uniref:TRAP dicarboxylate transporter, DctM subunit n=1 Tax=uncultured delta proteobacterium TaxID=34034 RepID=A0A212JTJ1_9DELT|nr:TRAP dicarboxylate transporter, DctM subunit [uncultured delta proteobacterium]
MTPSLLVLASIVLLLACICFFRIPIGMLLTALGFFGYALLDGTDTAVAMLGNEFWSTFSNAGLTVVPLFVFMGQLCFHSGLSGRLYQAIASWIGHLRGGVAAATLVACGGFSAICGSNTATAATMSVVSLPEMQKRHYHPAFAAGVVATGTTLGAVIPPSVVAIVLGIQTGLSIRKLFVGGILPGLVLLGLFLLTVAWVGKNKPLLAPAGERMSMAERIRTLPGLFEALFLFALVVGGLSAGAFTPTEAGAAGSVLALVIGIARRGLSCRKLAKAVFETMNVSAMIFLLLAGAGCYGKFLAVSRTPFMVAEWVQSLQVAPAVVLALIFFVYLVGGMIMDALALLLITLPIFFPLVERLGYDPLWFSLVLLVVTTLGAITPPVGASAYVVASMGKISLGSVFRGTLFFIPAFFVCLGVMTAFPGLVMLLPDMVQ